MPVLFVIDPSFRGSLLKRASNITRSTTTGRTRGRGDSGIVLKLKFPAAGADEGRGRARRGKAKHTPAGERRGIANSCVCAPPAAVDPPDVKPEPTHRGGVEGEAAAADTARHANTTSHFSGDSST